MDNSDRLWPLPSTFSSYSSSRLLSTHTLKKEKGDLANLIIFILCTPHFSKANLANLIILVRKAKGGGMHAHFWINFHQCQRACVWKVAARPANPPSAKTREKKNKGWAIGMTFGFYEKPGRMRVVMVSLKLIRASLVVGRVRI